MDDIVVNRERDASVTEVAAIIAAERLKRSRQIGLADAVAAELPGSTRIQLSPWAHRSAGFGPTQTSQ